MMKNGSLLALFALLTVTVACDDDPTSPGNTDPLVFDATLSGAAERPAPVVTNATGTGTFTVTKGSTTGYDPDASGATTVTYSVSVTGLSGQATMAHIHGPAGTNAAADVIVPLTVIGTSTTGIIISGSFTSTNSVGVSMDSLVLLLQNGNSYLNVHTIANPAGEIRGQILEDQ